MRAKDPKKYIQDSIKSMGEHVQGILKLKKMGSIVFDYGNNLRSQAQKAGVKEAYDYPGFVPEYIRPLFCKGMGPFRWVALSGRKKIFTKLIKKYLKCSLIMSRCVIGLRWLRKRLYFRTSIKNLLARIWGTGNVWFEVKRNGTKRRAISTYCNW